LLDLPLETLQDPSALALAQLSLESEISERLPALLASPSGEVKTPNNI
jgi:hypothetical protein